MDLNAVLFSEVRFLPAKRPRSLPKLKALEAGYLGKGSAPKEFWRVGGGLIREKNLISSFHPDAFIFFFFWEAVPMVKRSGETLFPVLSVTFSGVTLNKFF